MKTLFSISTVLFLICFMYVSDIREVNTIRIDKNEPEITTKNVILIGTTNYLTVYGASSGNTWYSSDKIRTIINKETKFRIFNNKSLIGTYKSDSDIEQDEYCDCPDIKFDFKSEVRTNYIGITGAWNIYPNEVYNYEWEAGQFHAEIKKFLNSKGLTNPKINIKKVIETDIDNDGDDDIFIVASHSERTERGASKKGSYSVILWLDNKKVTPIDTKIFHKDGQSEQDELIPSEIVLIADLNGDKKMELLITSGYYEGGGHDIYTLKNGKFESFIGCSCGT